MPATLFTMAAYFLRGCMCSSLVTQRHDPMGDRVPTNLGYLAPSGVTRDITSSVILALPLVRSDSSRWATRSAARRFWDILVFEAASDTATPSCELMLDGV